MIGILGLVLQLEAMAVAPVQCEMHEERRGTDIVLSGGCGGTEVVLRSGLGYEMTQNAATGAIVVVVRNIDGPRLFVLRPDPFGHSILEELTGQLLERAGEHSGSGLYGWTIDLSRFATEGLISIAKDRSTRRLTSYVIGDAMRSDEARLSRRSAPMPVISVVPEGRGPEALAGAPKKDKSGDIVGASSQSVRQEGAGR